MVLKRYAGPKRSHFIAAHWVLILLRVPPILVLTGLFMGGAHAQAIAAEEKEAVQDSGRATRTLPNEEVTGPNAPSLKAGAIDPSGETPALALPDVGEALQLDRRLGALVEKQFAVFDHPALSTSLLGRLTAATLLFFMGLLFLKLNSMAARRFDRRLAGWRRRKQLAPDRLQMIFIWQRWAGYGVGIASLFYFAELTVGPEAVPRFVSSAAETLVDNVAGIAVVILIVILLWEGVNTAMERLASRASLRDSARARTLLPVVRNVIMFALLVMTALVVLSEIGIEIMPLLAGAGVVGIAIGFGAQTLVKDFLTGFTIIVEDLLQIGDVVRIADRAGAVSQITLRKIELRALDGTVHTIPFSAIDIVDNLTKDYSYYLMDIGVAYKENTDDVVACLRRIDDGLRREAPFRNMVLAPLEVFGVDQFADSAVIIKARIKTRAMDQWTVGREFNRRMKHAFDEQGIEIPFPHRTLFIDPQRGSAQLSNNAKEEVSNGY